MASVATRFCIFGASKTNGFTFLNMEAPRIPIIRLPNDTTGVPGIQCPAVIEFGKDLKPSFYTRSISVQIIAHRGASHDAPENTLAALDLAWRQKADASEVDVQLSLDGHLVVCHDKDTQRTTGVAGKISELTLAQIQALDAGSWKGSEWQGEKIPTLAEVLAHLPSDKQLVIELKGDSSLVAPLEATLIRAHYSPEQLILIGFDIPAMQEAKRRFPNLSVLLLFRLGLRVEWFIDRTLEVGADGLDLYHYQFGGLNWVQKAKAAGLKTVVWTVDDDAVARRYVEAGIDGITTNRPGWLREQLATVTRPQANG